MGIFGPPGHLTRFQHSKARVVPSGPFNGPFFPYPTGSARFLVRSMRVTLPLLLLLSLLAAAPARADLHIIRDHGGYVDEYKTKYQRIRDRHERVIIDGICNSACTLVLGIVPMNKICVTPRASLRQGLYLRHQGHHRGRDVRPD